MRQEVQNSNLVLGVQRVRRRCKTHTHTHANSYSFKDNKHGFCCFIFVVGFLLSAQCLTMLQMRRFRAKKALWVRAALSHEFKYTPRNGYKSALPDE
jgi:hypothetical protein